MANVSKRPLKSKVLVNIFSQLAKIVARSNNKNASRILESLLTETERIIIAKRLAAILMIAENCPTAVVAKTLDLSRSTVNIIRQNFYSGKYEAVLEIRGKSKKEREQMWESLDKILRLGMPSMGSDRWDWMKDRSRNKHPK